MSLYLKGSDTLSLSDFEADRSLQSGIIDGYRPPLDVIIAVLQGTFDFNHMHQNFIRPVVWVIAHCQPGNASERSAYNVGRCIS